MFDLDRFIADCRTALAEPAPELAIREILARATAVPSDVEAALGTPREGGLVALHRSAELTIVNVVWAPGMSIYPHEHRMWSLIALYGGREDNTFYRRSPDRLVVAGTRRIEPGATVLLGQAVIHAVANPLRVFTGAIHVYGGDFFDAPRSEWCPETLQERPFDLERARRVFADANARWRAESAELETPSTKV